jgi:hypothetical protein
MSFGALAVSLCAQPQGRRRVAAVGLAMALAFAAMLTGRATARAQDQLGEVLVVLASEQGGTIDANLAQEPALRQPPFNAYRSMRLLERRPVTLGVGRPAAVELPNGRRVQITLAQRLPNGRLQVRVSINRPEQNDYLQGVTVETSAGVPFFIAGQAFQGGTLVIGVRVGVRGTHGVRVTPVLQAPSLARPTPQPGAVQVAAPPAQGAVPPAQGAVQVAVPPTVRVQAPTVQVAAPPAPGAVRVNAPPAPGAVRVNAPPAQGGVRVNAPQKPTLRIERPMGGGTARLLGAPRAAEPALR